MQHLGFRQNVVMLQVGMKDRAINVAACVLALKLTFNMIALGGGGCP